MPKLACPCGYVHNLSPIPDDGWQTGLDRDWEEIIKDEYALLYGDEKNGAEAKLGVMYECPECGRLMWKKPGADRFSIYKPEPS
jgi:hypothetical protein